MPDLLLSYRGSCRGCPRCKSAKSLELNPLRWSRAMARASPMASWTMVLAVGARLLGSASFSTGNSRQRSHWLAKKKKRWKPWQWWYCPLLLKWAAVPLVLPFLHFWKEADDYIVFINLAKITVNGIGSVHKYSLASCRIKSGYHLLTNDGTFAYARNHNFAFTGEKGVDCFHMISTYALLEGCQSLGLNLQSCLDAI